MKTTTNEMYHNSSTTGVIDEQAIIDALNDWKSSGNFPPEDLALDPEKDHVIWLVSPWRRQQVVLGESWDRAKLVRIRAKLHQLRTG